MRKILCSTMSSFCSALRQQPLQVLSLPRSALHNILSALHAVCARPFKSCMTGTPGRRHHAMCKGRVLEHGQAM